MNVDGLDRGGWTEKGQTGIRVDEDRSMQRWGCIKMGMDVDGTKEVESGWERSEDGSDTQKDG